MAEAVDGEHPRPQTIIESIQRVACVEKIFRALHEILGAPQSEEESYTDLADTLVQHYEAIRNEVGLENNNNNTSISTSGAEGGESGAAAAAEEEEKGSGGRIIESLLFTRFVQALREEYDDAIPDEGVQQVFAIANGHLRGGVRALMQRGAEQLMGVLTAESEADQRGARRGHADGGPGAGADGNVIEEGEAAGTADRGPVTRVTAEERYRLQTLVRLGLESESVLLNVRDENEERGVEVEVNEQLPTFLMGMMRKHRINYRFTAQEREERFKKFRNADQFTSSMQKVAERQSTLNKERKALRNRERARQRAAGELLDEGTAKPEILVRDVDERPEAEEPGIRSAADLRGKRLPAWLEKSLGGDRSFGKKTKLSIREQQARLPITEKKALIMEHLREHQVTVLVGETGSGKTTQIPQYLAELFGSQGVVGCTQPRRVAAVSLAERVAEEWGCAVGEEVGYSVRFQEMTSSMTRIKYMTDGMLLREALLDDTFPRYSCIILDEAHERSICTDVLFGILCNAVKKRSSLRLVVTSATLDTQRFCSFFGVDEPLIIKGRTYAVDELFEDEPADDYVEVALNKVMTIHLTERPGDILVFFTGQDEIETAAERLYSWTQQVDNMAELVILPLYATLPNEVQSKVFEPAPPLARKVVLATNVAETSITIDNLYYVIDPGFCKQNVFNPSSGVEQLKIVPISRAQAKQRAGRAGRVGPGGKCYHLYTRQQFDCEMLQATVPEIQRTNLCNIVLTLKAVGIKDLFSFNFMDPPPREILASAMEKLYHLGALQGEDGILTPLGRRMSALPLEPSQSKTLLTAVDMGCASTVLSVVSMLSTRNVFYRPRDKAEASDRAKSSFDQPEGDPLTLLRVYDEWLRNGKEEKWCRDHFINPRSLTDAHDTRAQLRDILAKSHTITPDDVKTRDLIKVRKAITAGYFFQVAKRLPNGKYVTMADRREVYIHPSSSLFWKSPKFLVYHELVMTTKEYMREVMEIEAAWLPELAPAFYRQPEKGQLTREQLSERIDPIQRFNTKANDWRISKLKVLRR